jgi:hypothetical protein
MPKPMLMLEAMLMVVTGLVCGGLPATAAPKDSAANVEQVDLQEGWRCEGPTEAGAGFSALVEVPGSSLALTTAGHPVMVSLTVNMALQPQRADNLR